MTEKIETSRQIFSLGFNCAQAVLSTFSPDLGLSRMDALRVSGMFGSGMRQGEVCGAVIGAFMVIGLVSSKTGPGPDEDEKRERGYSLTREFTDRFSALHASINCHELIGVDLSTEAGLTEARDKGLFTSRCARFVEDAVRILDDLLIP